MAIYIKSTGNSYNRKSLVELFLTEKPATYSDAACTKEQCRSGAFRSVTELLEIVQTHFKQTSLKGLMKIIMRVISERKNVELIYCTQVKKVVLKYVRTQSLQEQQYVTNYSLGHYKNTKGVDGYSIADFLQIIEEIKSEK